MSYVFEEELWYIKPRLSTQCISVYFSDLNFYWSITHIRDRYLYKLQRLFDSNCQLLFITACMPRIFLILKLSA